MEQLNSGEVIDLHSTYWGGIRKTLWYLIGSGDRAWITVQDNQGDSFAFDLPREMPEGMTPLKYFDHIMLESPNQQKGRGNIYSAPE